MAKPFAISFYNSAAWKACRDSYVSERTVIDGGMCERCQEVPGEELHHKQVLTAANIHDSDVTLSRDNLKWLCKNCHFAAHRELIMTSVRRAKPKPILNDMGYYFDDNGELRQTKTFIVWGSPGSGKTTYVRANMHHGDLVVDLDEIKRALSLQDRAHSADNLLGTALSVRDCVYDLMVSGEVDARTKWVIATLPARDKRQALAQKLGAELIYIDSTYHECISRVKADTSRGGELERLYQVDSWWERFQV